MLVLIVVLSLLPDIDIMTSLFGKIFGKLSRWIHTKYGHRSVTHSIFATLFVFMIFSLIEYFFKFGLSPLVLAWAHLSHTIADGMTTDGVKLMAPFDNSEYGLPTNKSYRFGSTYQTQFAIFGSQCLIISLGFTYLSQSGWTSYNQTYATPKTLFSEKTKSTDLLKVDWKILEGSIIKTGSGLLVHAENEDEFTLLDGDSLVHFNTKYQVIKETKFVHTKKKYFVERQTFINVNSDSLNRLIQSKIIKYIDVNSLETFQISENGILSRKSSAKLKFPNHLNLKSLDSLPSQDSLFNYVDFESQRIENELIRLDNEFRFKLSEYNRKADSLRLYSDLARNESEEIRKEKLMRRRDEINVPDYPQKNFAEETYLHKSLIIARDKFQVEKQKREFDKAQSYQNKVRTSGKTSFTGVLEWIKIE
jgi:inner membrane protein